MKFQKVKDNRTGLEYDWMLVIDNEADILQYHESVFQSRLSNIWDNIINVMEGRAHYNNAISSLIAISHQPGESIVQTTAKVLDRIVAGKIKTLSIYGKIYQNKNGGYFGHHEHIEVLEEFISDGSNIIYPQYTKKDIRTIQWENGTHWYAYVGDFWVKKDDGTEKFNTQKEAYDCAKSYMLKLNNKDFEFKNK